MEADALQQVIQAMTGLTHKEINSIEISRNGKGDYSYSMKIYCIPGNEVEKVDYLKALDNKIKDVFGIK